MYTGIWNIFAISFEYSNFIIVSVILLNRLLKNFLNFVFHYFYIIVINYWTEYLIFVLFSLLLIPTKFSLENDFFSCRFRFKIKLYRRGFNCFSSYESDVKYSFSDLQSSILKCDIWSRWVEETCASSFFYICDTRYFLCTFSLTIVLLNVSLVPYWLFMVSTAFQIIESGEHL